MKKYLGLIFTLLIFFLFSFSNKVLATGFAPGSLSPGPAAQAAPPGCVALENQTINPTCTDLKANFDSDKSKEAAPCNTYGKPGLQCEQNEELCLDTKAGLTKCVKPDECRIRQTLMRSDLPQCPDQTEKPENCDNSETIKCGKTGGDFCFVNLPPAAEPDAKTISCWNKNAGQGCKLLPDINTLPDCNGMKKIQEMTPSNSCNITIDQKPTYNCPTQLCVDNTEKAPKIYCSQYEAKPRIDGPCTAATGSGVSYDCSTGLVGIHINPNPKELIKTIYGIILGITGGIALVIIVFSGYQIMTSQGNSDKIRGAKETLTSAIVGLLFIIFAFVILQFITSDILKIPGWG